jgi:hypothetical protein
MRSEIDSMLNYHGVSRYEGNKNSENIISMKAAYFHVPQRIHKEGLTRTKHLQLQNSENV